MSHDSARVIVFDTTLRDGEQAPGFSMDVPAKLTMARALDALGVDIIEAGFPIASPADSEATRQVAREVRRPVIAALARCRPQDIEEAARALEPAERKRIHTFLATSDLHLERKLRITREACLEADRRRRAAARATSPTMWSFRRRMRRAAIATSCAGSSKRRSTPARRPSTCPTRSATRTPDDIREFFAEIRSRVPNADKAIFSTHCHDDLGLAVANSLAAVQGGVRQIECTINGIGERAGNASLEELVMALRVRQDRLPYDTGDQRRERLFEASQLLSQLTDEPVQSNKAIVGRNAFAHEAGIHQDGMLKDARTYEIMRPQDVGQTAEQLVLGRHSGRHAVQRRCEQLGLALTRRRARAGLPRRHHDGRAPQVDRRQRSADASSSASAPGSRRRRVTIAIAV